MKNFQNAVIIATLIFLIAYTVYDKVTQSQNPAQYSLDAESFNYDLPNEFDFCGEPVPMKESDVRERFDKELVINIYKHSNTILILKRANRWLPEIEKILKEEGIPEDFKYLALIESDLQNLVSPRGATGYWQILDRTGRQLGLIVNDEVDERYDPIKSTRAACKYFKDSYAKFKNWTLVAASYNRGMAGMQAALDNQKVDNYYDLLLNSETSRYVFRILALKAIMTQPEKYGFKLSKKHLYESEKMRFITVDTSIKDLIAYALEQGVTYKTLKLYNPWLMKNSLTIHKDSMKSFILQVPVDASKAGNTRYLDTEVVSKTDSLGTENEKVTIEENTENK